MTFTIFRIARPSNGRMPSRTGGIKPACVLALGLAAFAAQPIDVRAQGAPAQQTYSVTALDPPAGYTDSHPIGLNAAGDIAGYSGASGFLWKNGVKTDLGNFHAPFPSTNATLGLALNAARQVVGWSTIAVFGLDHQRAFVWQNGVMSELQTLPNYLDSQANGINTSGQVVGDTWHPIVGSGTRALLWRGGVAQDLGTLGGLASTAKAINDGGQIVGSSFLADHTTAHAFVWQNGAMKDLGALGKGTFSVASAINGAGEIVGVSTFAGPGQLQDRHAFVYRGGVMTDLGVPGPNLVESAASGINQSGTIVGNSGALAYVNQAGVWTDLNTLVPQHSGITLTSANAINDAGQIVATGTRDTSRLGRYAFLLTPVAGSPVPPAPHGLAATAVTGKVTLSWQASAGATQGYTVKRYPLSGGPYRTIATSVVATSYIDTSLPLNQYYYVVAADNDFGESRTSNEVHVNIP